ncbi:MAG TPA: hypothetical protein VG413_00770 [Candidatus Dormibacteraeota bacterium]|nr:hypothetical protein [Candidatus Dormibacteraeota bacterium]
MARLERPEIGWLGELAVDQAVVIGSGGRLIPWIPLIDAHGVDRAYCWDGVEAPSFAQIKTSGFADEEGRHRWDLRVGSFAPYAQFSVVLALIDPKTSQMGDVFWRLDSTVVRRLARREYDAALRTEVYRLDASPTHDDRLAPYRRTRTTLWKGFAPAAEPRSAAVRQLPILRIDQGGVYEFAMFAEVLRGNHKDLLLFRPAFDIRGRDLLVQLVNSPYASFVQIKGTAVLRGKDLVRFHLRRNTFVPADDFWVALYFWETRRGALFPECWLVPSLELARRTAHQRDANYLTVDARLNPSLDRWADWRHPIQDQADVLRAALRELRAAA